MEPKFKAESIFIDKDVDYQIEVLKEKVSSEFNSGVEAEQPMKGGIEMIADEHIEASRFTPPKADPYPAIKLKTSEDFSGVELTSVTIEEIINWEQRRYELAKAAMQGILANQEYQVSQDGCYPPYIQNLVKDSISFADEMVKQFKGKQYE